MDAADRQSRAPASSLDPLAVSAMLAIAAHCAFLLWWHLEPKPAPVLEIEGDSVEVALVEAAPAAETAPIAPEPLVVSPPEPPPVSEPAPTPPEMVQPRTTPAPKPAATPPPAPKSSRPVSRPHPAAPGSTATGSGGTASAGTSAGAVTTRPAGKPAYLVRPEPVYPAESRAAREQGVVTLRLTVNAEGRPTAVSVAKSSGFPRLDRAAVEAGWRARVSVAGSGTQFDAPVRFNLRD